MTAETRKRRKYTDEFKRDAVSLVTEQGYSVAEAARSLGINSNLLGRWKHTFEEEASGIRLNAEECEELKRLRKENRLLRMEKEIFYRGDIGSTNRRYKPLEVDFWQVGGRNAIRRDAHCCATAPANAWLPTICRHSSCIVMLC